MNDKKIIYKYFCNYIKQMGHKSCINGKTFIIKDMTFENFYKEIYFFIGGNPFKYFISHKFHIYEDLFFYHNNKNEISNYASKTIIKINKSGLIYEIEKINKINTVLEDRLLKKYYYLDGKCIKHEVILNNDDLYTYDFTLDENDNYVFIHMDNNVIISNDNMGKEELTSYTKGIKKMMYISDLSLNMDLTLQTIWND